MRNGARIILLATGSLLSSPCNAATKISGTFMHIWKNVGGKWKNVAEISSVSP
jgi:hypothetical protein